MAIRISSRYVSSRFSSDMKLSAKTNASQNSRFTPGMA